MAEFASPDAMEWSPTQPVPTLGPTSIYDTSFPAITSMAPSITTIGEITAANRARQGRNQLAASRVPLNALGFGASRITSMRSAIGLAPINPLSRTRSLIAARGLRSARNCFPRPQVKQSELVSLAENPPRPSLLPTLTYTHNLQPLSNPWGPRRRCFDEYSEDTVVMTQESQDRRWSVPGSYPAASPLQAWRAEVPGIEPESAAFYTFMVKVGSTCNTVVSAFYNIFLKSSRTLRSTVQSGGRPRTMNPSPRPARKSTKTILDTYRAAVQTAESVKRRVVEFTTIRRHVPRRAWSPVRVTDRPDARLFTFEDEIMAGSDDRSSQTSSYQGLSDESSTASSSPLPIAQTSIVPMPFAPANQDALPIFPQLQFATHLMHDSNGIVDQPSDNENVQMTEDWISESSNSEDSIMIDAEENENEAAVSGHVAISSGAEDTIMTSAGAEDTIMTNSGAEDTIMMSGALISPPPPIHISTKDLDATLDNGDDPFSCDDADVEAGAKAVEEEDSDFEDDNLESTLDNGGGPLPWDDSDVEGGAEAVEEEDSNFYGDDSDLAEDSDFDGDDRDQVEDSDFDGDDADLAEDSDFDGNDPDLVDCLTESGVEFQATIDENAATQAATEVIRSTAEISSANQLQSNAEVSGIEKVMDSPSTSPRKIRNYARPPIFPKGKPQAKEPVDSQSTRNTAEISSANQLQSNAEVSGIEKVMDSPSTSPRKIRNYARPPIFPKRKSQAKEPMDPPSTSPRRILQPKIRNYARPPNFQSSKGQSQAKESMEQTAESTPNMQSLSHTIPVTEMAELSLRPSQRRVSKQHTEKEEAEARRAEEAALQESIRKVNEEKERLEREAKAKAEAEAEERQAAAEAALKKQKDDNAWLKKVNRKMVPDDLTLIKPLSGLFSRTLNDAMLKSMGYPVAVTTTGDKLSRRDFGTVLPQPNTADPPNAWLNDEIISAYLQLCINHGNNRAGYKRGETPTYHAFNPFFYKNLATKGYDSVKRWAAKAKIGGKDLLKVEYVFIPVNPGVHWTLLVISPQYRTIEYFDSMSATLRPATSNSYTNLAKTWLRNELGNDYHDREWTVRIEPGPQQKNTSDCGVFAVTNAKMITLGWDPKKAYEAAHIPNQRRSILAELMYGRWDGEFASPRGGGSEWT